MSVDAHIMTTYTCNFDAHGSTSDDEDRLCLFEILLGVLQSQSVLFESGPSDGTNRQRLLCAGGDDTFLGVSSAV